MFKCRYPFRDVFHINLHLNSDGGMTVELLERVSHGHIYLEQQFPTGWTIYSMSNELKTSQTWFKCNLIWRETFENEKFCFWTSTLIHTWFGEISLYNHFQFWNSKTHMNQILWKEIPKHFRCLWKSLTIACPPTVYGLGQTHFKTWW